MPKSQNLHDFLAVEKPVYILVNIPSFSTDLGITSSLSEQRSSRRFAKQIAASTKLQNLMKLFGSGSGHRPQKGKFNHIQYSRFPCEILPGIEKSFITWR